MINDREFGNGRPFSPVIGTGRASSRIRSRFGMVGVNVPIPVPMAFHFFGGWFVTLRRSPHARKRGRAFLYEARDNHDVVANLHTLRRGLRNAYYEIVGA
jgi:hypothetical protein